MADPYDIVEIPGYPGMYARRIVVQMWQNAGSPHINDAGRLYQKQLDARLAYEGGWGSPADDPRRPDRYPLAHVRFAALDVVNSARSAMIAAGFEYPYDYEPWHGQLPNIYSYPLVEYIPATASSAWSPFPNRPKEDDMAYPIRVDNIHLFLIGFGNITHLDEAGPAELTMRIVSGEDRFIDLTGAQFYEQLENFGIPGHVVDIANGRVLDIDTQKLIRGGYWSWAKDASSKAGKPADLTEVLSAIAALDGKLVTPPKA